MKILNISKFYLFSICARILVILSIIVTLGLGLTVTEQQNVAAFNDKNQEQIHQNSKVCSNSFGCQVVGGSTENSASLHVNSNSIPNKDSQCKFFTHPRTGGNH